MSRAVLVGVLLALVQGAGAGADDAPDASRLRILIVADTNDATIGESVQTDVHKIRFALETGIPEARRTLDVLVGDAVTPERILARVASWDVGPTESLLFYYAGHGAWSDAGPYFRMNGGKILPRSDLVKALTQKKGRLTILLTDCCSTYVGKTAMMMLPWPDPDTFRDLFFRHRGVVDVTAAKRGQEAVGDGMMGGYFTNALSELLTSVPRAEIDGDHDRIVTWKEAVHTLTVRTQGIFESLNPRGLTVKGAVLKGQTPQVFGDMALPAAGPIPPSKQRLGVRVAETDGHGARIDEVVPDSPAAWMGVKAGHVVTMIRVLTAESQDDTEVKRVEDFAAALRGAKGSALVALTLEPTGPDGTRDPSNSREVFLRIGP